MNTPTVTDAKKWCSLRRWLDKSVSSFSFGGFRNRYNLPKYPYATSPGAISSQEIQNQTRGSKKKPITAIEVAETIPEIIWALLVFVAACEFMSTFSSNDKKKYPSEKH